VEVFANFLVLALGLLYAFPNLYPDDPALQLSTQKATSVVDEQALLRGGQVRFQKQI